MSGNQPQKITLNAVAVSTDDGRSCKLVEPDVAVSQYGVQPTIALLRSDHWTVGCTPQTLPILEKLYDWESISWVDREGRGVSQSYHSASAAFNKSGDNFADMIQRQVTMELLSAPSRWPQRPFLPLLRSSEQQHLASSSTTTDQPSLRSEFSRVGVIFEDAPLQVWVDLNLFELPHFGGELTPEAFIQQGGRVREYSDIEQLLADGWRAD